MTVNTTDFNGLYVLESNIFVDDRGSFKKLLNSLDFTSYNLDSNFHELYYSINKKNVIRGMHFQIPPHDHNKLVYCISGSITDVCLDLRKKSLTYGKYFVINLDENDSKYLYIPKGFAHGFISNENKTVVHYAQTSCYNKENDAGLRYDSFGYDWGVSNPIVSKRDLEHPIFQNFISPF